MTLNSNQPALPRAITVRASVSDMQSRRGPQVTAYNFPEDRGRVFKWTLGPAVLTQDGVTVIDSNGQGSTGQWILMREPVDGADIPDVAATTITVSEDFYRRLPTVGQATVITLGTTNAQRGDIITITRTDSSAFTVAVVNGGPGAGTLVTFLSGLEAFGDFYFDGTNWEKMRAATMLA